MRAPPLENSISSAFSHAVVRLHYSKGGNASPIRDPSPPGTRRDYSPITTGVKGDFADENEGTAIRAKSTHTCESHSEMFRQADLTARKRFRGCASWRCSDVEARRDSIL